MMHHYKSLRIIVSVIYTLGSGKRCHYNLIHNFVVLKEEEYYSCTFDLIYNFFIKMLSFHRNWSVNFKFIEKKFYINLRRH